MTLGLSHSSLPRLAAGLVGLVAALAAGTAGVLWLCLPPLTPPPAPTLEDQLLRGCAAALLVAWSWLALGALALTGELLATGEVRWSARLTPRLARLLVAGLVGSSTIVAAPTAGAEVRAPAPLPAATVRVVDGLPLPDRPVGPRRVAPTGPPVHVVAAGDTLWAVARAHGLSWQRLYDANRSTVGEDPDLIRPGMRLVVPGAERGTR